MQWHWVDLAIILIIALSMLTGLFRGFVKEIIALATWGLAIWCGFNYSQLLHPWLTRYISDQGIRTVVSFLLILFAVLLAGGIVNAFLSLVLKKAGLNGTDRTLGMGFGLIRGIFIVALILTGVKMTALPYQNYSQESKLYSKFDPVVSLIYSYMPEFIKRVKTMDPQENSMEIVVSN